MQQTSARVYKSTGSWYDLRDDDGRAWRARIKGVFKIDGITSTNPIAVGDQIAMEVESEEDSTAMIVDILPRNNYISRQSPSHRKQHHIIASNLDQTMLVATLRQPRTSSGFIDRFLVSAEAYHIPAILVLNKCDTWKAEDRETFETWAAAYSAIGYPTLAISAQTGEGMDQFYDLLRDKTTLLSGHSGVGKSTILNALFPDMALRTGEVSQWSGKGLHTTTFAQMFDLEGIPGRVIDTPGVKEFGLVNISREELSHYFPEMREALQHCRFNNCLHINEPGCEVRRRVERGEIWSERYINYRSILDSLPEHDWA